MLQLSGSPFPIKKRRDYLLRGKIFCGCCDHAMSLRNDVWFYCRHSEVAKELPCYGVKVKNVGVGAGGLLIRPVHRWGRHWGLTAAKTSWICRRSSRPSMKISCTLSRTANGSSMNSMRLERSTWKPTGSGKRYMTRNWCRQRMSMLLLPHRPNRYKAITKQRLKQREIVQEVGSAGTLTQALIDRLISKVYIFPGDRIEIEYVTQDFLGIDESGKEA